MPRMGRVTSSPYEWWIEISVPNRYGERRWLEENLGRRRKHGPWTKGPFHWRFRSRDDAMWFRMVWG